MLDMDIHPSSLDFVDVLGLKPPKKDCSPEFSDSRFLFVVEVLVEPQLTRNGYDLRSLVEQFDARPAEIRRLLRGDLDAGRAQELMDEMRAAGLPT